ncbi:hypothetical protein [Ruminococcus albus]|uniref:hypothetical protein n=1 Tax=Ruminococcus albus TaxID=1264 RepID=UPI00046388CA|nr:hypothetical protein [Ruminococcus albus]
MDKTDIKVLAGSCAVLAAIGFSIVTLAKFQRLDYDHAVRIADDYSKANFNIEDLDIDIVRADIERSCFSDVKTDNIGLKNYLRHSNHDDNSATELDSQTATLLGEVIAEYENEQYHEYLDANSAEISDKTFDGCTNGFLVSGVNDEKSLEYFTASARIAHYPDKSCVEELKKIRSQWWEKYTDDNPNKFDYTTDMPTVFSGTAESDNAYFTYEVRFDYGDVEDPSEMVSVGCTYFGSDYIADYFYYGYINDCYRGFLKFLRKEEVTVPEEIIGLPDNIEKEE